MKERLYDWFEQEWQASIRQVRIQRAHKIAPPFWGTTHNMGWSDAVEVDHVPIMQIEIAEPDLTALIRDLKDHKAHAEIQKRYPQLREAYMNYLTQVYLTVDQMPD